MFSKRCGIGKISKHYAVGHGSVPCRPLFVIVIFFYIYIFTMAQTLVAVGDVRHVLQTLWSRKDIKTLQVGPWVCALSALVLGGEVRI